ncbi:MAG: ethanolamine ammonia-lyase reactivating factor EutA [Acetobacteraceae bacterium]|nr:ethanolamine ammonia-lyase reactivating factor EutA [Acetobacteraceae bacterium]
MSEAGGRVFFARARRAPDRDADIRLTSVGVDIGSATSHLAFSRLILRRKGNAAVLLGRELLHESAICLTPYAADGSIDTTKLGDFIGAEYAQAGISRDAIDTGALILTGLAARRRNARAIGALFAAETGRFVAVAAGDALETVLAAHGSGAVAASAVGGTILHLDMGGGTAKIARCSGGEIVALTAIDIGARLVVFDEAGRIARLEAEAAPLLEAAGLRWSLGDVPHEAAIARLAQVMAQCLFEACGGAEMSSLTAGLLRLPAMEVAALPDGIGFSGGVAEYLHGREDRGFGDLGPALARAVHACFGGWAPFRFADHGIRATVVGASQFSVQVSGNTIFVDPPEVLPLASLPAIRPLIAWDRLSATQLELAIRAALVRMGVAEGDGPVALAYEWQGDATHDRIAAFCAGVSAALAGRVPLVLVGQGDFGGLIGTHLRRSGHRGGIVSIDGITLRELDHIDIGELLQISGGVPVVVKSLVF